MASAAPALAMPDMTSDIPTRVRVAQMRMIFEQTSVAVFAATAYAVALVLYLHGAIPAQTLAIWIGLKIAVVIPRVLHGRMFRHRHNDSLSWLAWGRAMLFLDGLVWGMAGIFLTATNDTSVVTLVIATLAGVSTVAAFVLHADWPCCVAYTAPMQLPGVLMMFSPRAGLNDRWWRC
jgi:hypothetical protein